MGTAMDTNEILTQSRKGKTDEPRMNQPSREAMAGKLQVYADRLLPWSAAFLQPRAEADGRENLRKIEIRVCWLLVFHQNFRDTVKSGINTV